MNNAHDDSLMVGLTPVDPTGPGPCVGFWMDLCSDRGSRQVWHLERQGHSGHIVVVMRVMHGRVRAWECWAGFGVGRDSVGREGLGCGRGSVGRRLAQAGCRPTDEPGAGCDPEAGDATGAPAWRSGLGTHPLGPNRAP